MSDSPAPLVFLSHTTADKERFVISFATRLRAAGVNAWLDKWEIYPGDSLVDKIFEEGLKNAAAVIIVLSSNSVGKAWVREELNASVVARIQKGTRLIPVVLDAVEVPEALKNTVWVEINDLSDYDDELARIIATVFGHRPKPPLGHPPEYVNVGFAIQGLTAQDAAVLKVFCERAVEKDSPYGIMTDAAARMAEQLGIGRAQFLESAQILAERYLLKPSEVVAKVPPHYSVTTEGFDEYAHAVIPHYREIYRTVASEIVNRGKTDHREIAAAAGQSLLVVEHILDVMEGNGLLKQAKTSGRRRQIHSLSPRLKRLLEEGA